MAAEEDAQVAVVAAIKTIDPMIEGYKHELEAADLSPDARAALTAILQAHTTYRAALETRRTASDALVALGYPTLPPAVVPASVYAEVSQNRAAADAAFAHLSTEPPVDSGTFTLGTPEPKP